MEKSVKTVQEFTSMTLPKKVVIIGDPGSGKTYISSLLNRPVIHTDDYIKYGFKESLYELMRDLKDSFIVEGVIGYRLLRKARETGVFEPDLIVEVKRPLEQIEEVYKSRKGDFQGALNMMKANQTVIKDYKHPNWIIVENAI